MLSVYSMMFSLSMIVIFPLTGWLIDALGFVVAFIYLGFFLVIVGFSLFFILKEMARAVELKENVISKQ